MTTSRALGHSDVVAKPALGRGLGALLGGSSPSKGGAKPASVSIPSPSPAPEDARQRVDRISLGDLRPCPLQPRKDFSEESLRELADSIREQGIVQPLIVRKRGDHFELIAGERRWRAAQLAGLTEVPVLVREADDAAVLELALIENLQRENLNPIEEALGYQQLMDQFNLRQEDVATKVGKGRVSVANALRLLRLPGELQTHVRTGRLSVGHAKVILALSGGAEQKLAADKVLKEAMNVRQTEDLVARLQGQATTTSTSSARAVQDPDIHAEALAGRLRERLGTKVVFRFRKGKGSIEIRFFNDDDLERLLQLIGVSPE